jgi:hypothetical protein
MAPRSIAGAASPLLAGSLLALSSVGLPLILGGALNNLYDLLVLIMFRRVRWPEGTLRIGLVLSDLGRRCGLPIFLQKFFCSSE